ncbi:hypothetical protein Tco_0123745 [Tanacetum coccineum]
MLLELLYLPLEQLEVTLRDENVLAKVKATRKRKASTTVGTSAKSSYRKRLARRSYKNNTTSLDASRTAIPERALEQLEVTLSGEKVLARVEATRKRKASSVVGISTETSESRTLDDDDLDMNDRGEQKNEDQVLNVLPLRSVGVAKGGNVGGQAMPPPQEIHTGFDPRGSGADDLGNQLADDAPMNGNDYEINGGNDHSHDGGHPNNEVDVENHEEPEQASSVPNDTSNCIEREIASPAPKRSIVCQAVVDQLPTHVDLFYVEGLNDDQLMDRTIATSLANDKEKSKGRKKLVRCQEKTIGKLTTKGTRLKKELQDARRAAEKKSD